MMSCIKSACYTYVLLLTYMWLCALNLLYTYSYSRMYPMDVYTKCTLTHICGFMVNIVCIPEQCVFQCTCNTSVHTNTSMLCNGCFISCYCLLLYRLLFLKKWDHDVITLLLYLGLDQTSGWWSCLVGSFMETQ